MNGLERKRAALPAPAQKKQRLETPAPEDDDKDQYLETFRKEAIWREMREYRRKLERAERNAEAVEQQRKNAEAKLSAVEVSWNLLVQQANLLLPSTSTNGTLEFDADTSVASQSLAQLSAALDQRSVATQELLSKLYSLHPPSDSEASTQLISIQHKCQTLADQAQRFREALRLLEIQHGNTCRILEETTEDLCKAQKKVDRLQSQSVQAIDVLKTISKPPTPEPQPTPPTAVDPIIESQEIVLLKGLADSREAALKELRAEITRLNLDLDSLKSKLAALPDEIVTETTPFKELQIYVQYLLLENETKGDAAEKAIKEADLLREQQEAFKAAILKETQDKILDLQTRLQAKEADLARVRNQREELRGQFNEISAKDLEHAQSVAHLQALVSSCENRILAYGNESRRIRMELAIHKGDTSQAEFLAAAEENDILTETQRRLGAAESLLIQLKDELLAYRSSAQETEAGGKLVSQTEVQVRIELTKTQKKLGELEELLGKNPDIKSLADKLESSKKQMTVLNGMIASHDTQAAILYQEIDRLSTAWNVLETNDREKVFNVVSMEEKFHKLAAEKIKADNRYFAAMRQKDAITGENMVLQKVSEKQVRLLEAAKEVQHAQSNQIMSLEKELSIVKKNLRECQDALASSKRENMDLNLRAENSNKTIVELRNLLSERVKQLEVEQTQRRHCEEQLSKLEKETKTLKARQAPGSIASSEVQELKSYNDDLSTMLKCSTCKMRFKAAIINRCGHLFCKECIEARLTNRQRKCPTCGIAFGRDDVAPVFF